MAIRKCSTAEARLAAKNYGASDEHEFKKEIVGSYYSVSECDIFVDTTTKEIYVGNKNGDNLQQAFVKI